MLEKSYYRQKDGTDIIMVTKRGVSHELACFLASAEDEVLIDSEDWSIYANHDNVYPHVKYLTFHRALYGGTELGNNIIDHHNHCKFDNVRSNLSPKSRMQNAQNIFKRQYINNGKNFRVKLKVDTSKLSDEILNCDLIDYIDYKKGYIVGVSYNNEADVCKAVFILENLYKKCNPEYNLLDIASYRQDDFKNLFLERTGKISKEEADLRHLLTYCYNAWYMLRYNLEDLFKENHIKLPKYDFDANGFLVDTNHSTKLCPSRCNTRAGIINYSTYYSDKVIKEELTVSDYTSILNLDRKYFCMPKNSDFVDEDLLYTEMYNRFVNYREMGYSTRASLNHARVEYKNLYSDALLERMIDKLLDNVTIVSEITSAEKKEEKKAVISFFKSFCGVSLDTEQFLAEFSIVVMQKEKIGCSHKAAVLFSIDDYIHILGIDKLDLFVKYYEDEEKYMICKDFYQSTLHIEDLWKSLRDFEIFSVN